MKHESDKEGQSGKSHLFETGGISAVFFPQHFESGSTKIESLLEKMRCWMQRSDESFSFQSF